MKAKATIEKWLANIGLKLKESKTNIVHSLNSDNGQKPGFDFLGYTIRQFPDKNKRRGYKSYTRPSKQGQKEHLLTIKKILRNMIAMPQEKVIEKLNPIIKG